MRKAQPEGRRRGAIQASARASCRHPRRKQPRQVTILQALLVAGLVSFSIAKTYIHVDSFGEGWIGLY